MHFRTPWGTLFWAPAPHVPSRDQANRKQESLLTRPNPPPCRRQPGFTWLSLNWEFWTALEGTPQGKSNVAVKSQSGRTAVPGIRLCSVPWGFIVLSCCLSLQAPLPKRQKRTLLVSFYSSIADLQCHVNYCCTAKWFSYTYIYISFSFLYSFPLWLITGYWI